MRLPSLKRKGVSGFTLVEMAIVLVIIGIILAGVMKGRDIVRGAQVKQYSQQFAQKWATIAQTYYDKTGRVLLDGNQNGGAAGVQDGRMDGSLGTQIDVATTGVQAVLNRVGITPCTLVKSKLVTDQVGIVATVNANAACNDSLNIVATQVEGEYAGVCNSQVDLESVVIQRDGIDENRNCVVLYNVPTDVAIGLDTAIDGTENGIMGSFVNLADTTRVAASAVVVGTVIPSLVWPDADTAGTQTCAIILDF